MTLNNAFQSFTSAERQAAIAASHDPLVRRAARELDSKVGDAGIDADVAVDAHQQLTAAVADALAVLAPDAPEKVSDFAMQAALFAVGAPVFIAPPNTDMDEWIASMPDEALDGLRNSMVETGRVIRRHMGAGLRPGAKATEQPPDPNVGAPVLDSTPPYLYPEALLWILLRMSTTKCRTQLDVTP